MTELEFFEQMQEAMTAQAEEIWEMVRHSRTEGYRLRLGEVTATEHSFFRLRDFWTKRVYIVTNEPDELATGADWEWLIGHGSSWVQIRVQAKIINKNGGFAELGHPHSSGQQLDRLINPDPGAVTCRWLPLYVFYTAEPIAGVTVPPSAGCSAQLANVVRDVYGKPPAPRAVLKAAPYLAGSVPWASVFNGLVARLRSGQSLAEIVASLANRPLPAGIDRIDDFWDTNVANGTCARAVPSYVQEIVRSGDDEFDRSRMVRLEVDVSPGDRIERKSLLDSEPSSALLSRRSSEDDSSAHLPSRSVTVGTSGSERRRATLPSFVSVIDIDRLAATVSGA